MDKPFQNEVHRFARFSIFCILIEPLISTIIDEGINYETLLGKTKALPFIVSYVVSTSSLY